MRVNGIIAEFNPFHRGHEYFLRQAQKEACSDHTVVVLSGDFTQRGTPAVCDKHLRALMALRAGADLVIALPVKASCASAEFFASSGVFLLNALGVVTDISFGIEEGSPEELSMIAEALLNESEEYKQFLKEELKKGLSYPAARSNALLQVLPKIHDLGHIMNYPNDILAIEYLKALKKLDSPITPHCIKRMGAGYHDGRIEQVNSSALAIRNSILESGSPSSIESEVPDYVYSLLTENFHKTLPVFSGDFSEILRYSLLKAVYGNSPLTEYADVSKSLSDRISKKVSAFKDPESFIQLIKTKDLTYSRISRALLHIMLDMRSPEEGLNADNSYVRLLGFKESATPLLKEINKHSAIPVLSRLSDGPLLLSGQALQTFNHDLFATDLYNNVIETKFKTALPGDLSRKFSNKDGCFSAVVTVQ